MIHDNSRGANNHGNGGLFSKRQRAIVQVFETALPNTLTDREVKNRLGFEDMNSVRPRITELIKAGVLMECGSIEDPVTGMTVRISRLSSNQGKLF